MDFIGTGTLLADTDLPRFGALVGVGEDEIHAFLDVETNGRGFDAQGRPKMLFEPHKFYAHVADSARDRAVQLGLAYPKQGTRSYPEDSYPNLKAALTLDADAALKSASWGLGQVLGENFALAGYKDVLSFVDAMRTGEAAQLEAAVLFIKNAHLDDELRAHNWPSFARGYNGPNYAKNDYAGRLAAAFAKWSKIKDTPWPLPAAQTMAEALRSSGAHPTGEGNLAPSLPRAGQIANAPNAPVLNSIIGKINQAAADQSRAQPAAPAVPSPGVVILPAPPAKPAETIRQMLARWFFKRDAA